MQGLEQQVESLKSELAAQKSRRAVEDVETDDVETVPPKPKIIKSKPPSDAGPSKSRVVQVARKSTGGKPPRKLLPPVDEAQDSRSEIEEVVKDDTPAAKPKPKPKTKAKKADEPEPTTKRAGKAKAVEAVVEDDDDVQEVAEPPAQKRPAPKRKLPEKGSKGAAEEDEDPDVMIVEKPKKKAAAAPAKKKDTATSKSKSIPDEDEDEGDKAPPKKKKKINLFQTTQAPGPFAFDSLTHVSFFSKQSLSYSFTNAFGLCCSLIPAA